MATSTLPNRFGNSVTSTFDIRAGEASHNLLTKSGKLVTCELRIGDFNAGGLTVKVATIPEGFRPYRDTLLLGLIYVSTNTFDANKGYKPCRFEINTDGEVYTGWGTGYTFTWCALTACWFVD